MPTRTPQVTPNSRLAEIVAQALVDHELVPAERRDELTSRLAAGSVRQSDWRVYLDLPVIRAEAADADPD